jgi:hypothetical protein
MNRAWRQAMGVAAIGGALLGYAIAVSATTFNVSFNSTGMSGASAILAFDFIDGGPPSNSVVLSALTSNGTMGATSATGAVTGTARWTFTDTSFFNELLVSLGPLGTATSFSFTTSDNAPAGGSQPDAFFFSILDPNTLLPLFPTGDSISGEDALFEFDIGGEAPCRASLCVYSPVPAIQGFSLTVTPVPSAPEPGTLALLAVGIGALFARGRLR